MLIVEEAGNTEQTSYLQSKLLQHVDILYVGGLCIRISLR